MTELQSSSLELLELLIFNLPERTGGAEGFNFEKEHSILHKVRDILMLGWLENYSAQVIANLQYLYHMKSYISI